uniref:NADH dehydrogenase subunit 6 n=1 Tax=Harmostica fulvicornis TaxID=2813413 RepID=A0A8T9VUK0_9HEMI|nr:NADH dehydrogenase subunit 6 [Harmostica fulvicornis]UPI55335.1 NADH dehydrogenase subunit 6 [Harmostica fulvicornis]
MNILLFIMNMLSFLIIFTNHPIMMGMIIIIQTFNIAVIMNLMIKSFWFSYIIVIIMLSGMLVLFIYMASITSNKMMKPSMTLMMTSIIISYMITSTLTIYNNKTWLLMTINKMFSSSNNLTMTMIIYLLITMIIVSKIVMINKGPLRSK